MCVFGTSNRGMEKWIDKLFVVLIRFFVFTILGAFVLKAARELDDPFGLFAVVFFCYCFFTAGKEMS